MGLLFLSSCEKWKDKPAPDPGFTRHYCNDPEAVNYNWDFPGKPDNSTCFYPTQPFTGHYSYVDTIFDGSYEFDTFYKYDIYLFPVSNTKMRLVGLCPAGDTLRLTADKYYKAYIDSVRFDDSTFLPGSYFCTRRDTINGYLNKNRADSNKIHINFTVATDSGLRFHIGTGVRK
jgi:hypothetical protein